MTIVASSVTFRCEDAGKACQSEIKFPAAAFDAFAFSGAPSTFCVQLAAFADALRAFAALDAPVRIAEAHAHLVLETAAPDVSDAGTAVAMYAHVAILDSAGSGAQLARHWQPPATEFVCGAALLREAVDDLEWPQGHIAVAIAAQPLQARPASLRLPMRMRVLVSETQRVVGEIMHALEHVVLHPVLAGCT